MPHISAMLATIEKGGMDAAFTGLYGAANIPLQRQRYMGALRAFAAAYGGEEWDIRLYSVPGRTEIGGNHTDHNLGIVLAAAVNLDIIAVVAQTQDNVVRVISKGFGRQDTIDLSYLQPVPAEKRHSASLIRGVAADIRRRGGRVGGFNAYTTSDVLRGSGLSSSAAFEVCMACIFNSEYNQNRFTPVELGQIGQYAENHFFGKPSGLMDQTACAVGGAITIDFKDALRPTVRTIPFDLAAFSHKLVITNTGGSHAGLTDEYAAIANEMKAVAAFFGKTVLREISWSTVEAAIPRLRQKLGDRAVLRAYHFYEECRRAQQQALAIQSDDFEGFKRLVLESGHSSFEYNQNAYSVKKPASQGVALGLMLSQKVLHGKGAWRLQGGGFAGTIQAFVPSSLLQEYCAAMCAVFGKDACHILSVREQGAVEVPA